MYSILSPHVKLHYCITSCEFYIITHFTLTPLVLPRLVDWCDSNIEHIILYQPVCCHGNHGQRTGHYIAMTTVYCVSCTVYILYCIYIVLCIVTWLGNVTHLVSLVTLLLYRWAMTRVSYGLCTVILVTSTTAWVTTGEPWSTTDR